MSGSSDCSRGLQIVAVWGAPVGAVKSPGLRRLEGSGQAEVYAIDFLGVAWVTGPPHSVGLVINHDVVLIGDVWHFFCSKLVGTSKA